MKAFELIQNDVPPLRINESIKKAMIWMDEFKVNHLPVINDLEFVGLISDEMVYDYNNSDDLISNINFIGKKQFVLEKTHFFQVVQLLSNYKLSIVPVCDEQNNYKGSISGKHLLNIFCKQSGFNEKGAIIVLLVNNIDYHFSQIAQIIESNDSKILGMYSENIRGSNQLKLTLKISESNFGAIIQTFTRYDYVIEEIYSDSEIANNSQKSYDHLMHYLNL